MNRQITQPSSRGFSLLEVIAVVAVLGVIAAIAFTGVTHVNDGARLTKLESDVATVNQAMSIYVANGGSLAGCDTAQHAIDKLKTARAGLDAVKFAGLRGTMVDKRLKARLQTGAEAESSARRAIWTPTESRFVIATLGEGGVSEFLLDESLAAVDYGTEDRSGSLFDLNTGDGWIWAYEDTVSAPPPGPTIIPVGGGSSGSGSGSGSGGPLPPLVPGDLLPPVFSIPSGAYPASTFNKTLTISNPNGSSSSWIMVSVDGTTFVNYPSPLTITPGTTIFSYVTGDPIDWNPSSTVIGTYAAAPPIELAPPAITPSDPGFALGTVDTISGALSNPNDATISALRYRVDGGAWTAYSSAFDLAFADYPSGATIEARAITTSLDYYNSAISSESVSGGVALDPPVIATSAPGFIPATEETVSVTLTNPNPAADSSLQYRIDGGSWTPYSTPFDLNIADHFLSGAMIEAQAVATSLGYTDSPEWHFL